MSDLGERMAELNDQIESHPFHEISERMEEIRIVLDALEQNYDLLEDFIDEWMEDTDSFFDAPMSQRMEVRRELFRRLHNYLASYHTQYEFTKNLRNETIGEGNERYNQLIEEHDIRPTSDFLKALRNYIQKHVFLNVTTSFGSLTSEQSEVRTYLSAEELKELKSSYRNQKAEEFIDTYDGDEILITEVIENHHSDLLAFHEDFRQLIRDFHDDEFDEYTSLQSEFNEIASEKFGTK
jgi:hypothetical protein